MITMKNFQKLFYGRNGSQLALGLDLEKINQEDRVVVGFATLDNVDFAGDIVSAKASINAFKEFRGNVRSQHNKDRPVGKVIAFEPALYYDEETKKSYNGVRVAVRISKAAEDVWTMCLDGTLSGFSIGGSIKKASKVWNAELKKQVQVIEEIMFTELSLVDNPMNKLANITAISVHKSLDYDTIEKDFNTLNLFWCAIDKLAAKATGSESDCPSCGEAMANMGHIEENADIEKQLDTVFEVKMKGGHPSVGDTEITIEKSADAEEISTEVIEDETPAEAGDSPAAEAGDAEVISEANEDDAEETDVAKEEEEVIQDSDNDVEIDATEKVLADAIQQIKEVVNKSQENVEKGQTELRSEFDTLSEKIQKQLTELAGSYRELETKVDNVTEKLKNTSDDLVETQKRLDGFAGSTAVRKSLDSQNAEPDVTQKKESLFSGVFKP